MKKTPTIKPKQLEKGRTETSFEDAGKTGIATSKSTRITSLEELLVFSKVDLTKWEVERHIINKWEVGTKVDNEILVEPLFQIKAWLKQRKDDTEDLTKLFDTLLADFKKKSPTIKPYKYKKFNGEKYLLEFAIPDLHLGKLAWNEETGNGDYDLKIALFEFENAIEKLLSYASSFTPDRFLICIGHDLFNADNYKNETTGGTHQDCDNRKQKVFTSGIKVICKAVDKLSIIAPCDLIIVPGNHDQETVFYTGEVLAAYYCRNANVTVDNGPKLRKYYLWNNTLLGHTHGNSEKHANLPALMALEAPEQWAKSTFREWRIGHFHHKKDTSYSATLENHEEMSVVIRQLSSLSPADAWHSMKGYLSEQAAALYVHSKTKGLVAQFNYRPVYKKLSDTKPAAALPRRSSKAKS